MYALSTRASAPREFETLRERNLFLAREYFSKLKPNEPFLLVTQHIQNHLTSCRISHGTSGDFVDTHAYFGTCPEYEGPYDHDQENDIVTIRARPHVLFHKAFSGKRTLARTEDAHIMLFRFWNVPLTQEFDIPHPTMRHACSKQKGRALSVAVGIFAIEGLCLSGWGRFEDLPEGYLRAARILDWRVASDSMRTFRNKVRMEVLTRLLARKDAPPHERNRVLREALDYGFDRDTDPVKLGTLRYRPNELIEDLQAH